MLPPLWPSSAAMSTPELRSTCEPCCSSGQQDRHTDHEHGEHGGEDADALRGIAPTIFPNMKTCAAGMRRIASTREEVGDAVRVLERDGRVRVVEAAAVRPELLDRDLRCGRARARSPAARPRASSPWRGRRTSGRRPARSGSHRARARAAAGRRRASGRGLTQKFPRPEVERRANPRITATSTAIPTAAETKFCTASPAICDRYDIVYSPP